MASKKVAKRSDSLDGLADSLKEYKNNFETFGGLAAEVSIADIDTNQNIRVLVKDDAFVALKESILQQGLLQRPVVAKNPTGDKKYVCVAGHRRIEAMKDLGFTDIPCIFINTSKPGDIESARLAENVIRENLKPIELAEAVFKLKEQLQEHTTGIARVLNRSRSYVTELLSIAGWPQEAKDLAAQNELNVFQLSQIARIKLSDEEIIERVRKLCGQVSYDTTLERKGASGPKYQEKLDKWFESNSLKHEQVELIIRFLKENKVRGWV
ncbi:MAG TPA: ParB/RepB/Spo0J family partition protein [Oligoflexus sp.]|uniref:ParB/RepB/Spo0J family partition protein n=1 Tax=Oligoflexus sp. TaxID=1971216 RepID=UPI002D27A4E2|nr:ParB/RepB/Spo0J family partition protein [Oligoflexus sp.]HYX32200.1 ParB/RepB/Spo0J family partition protein [Oligoflexus sp.]